MHETDSAGGIAAGFNLAAIGVEYPHPEICNVRGFEQNQLVAADAGLAVSDCRSQAYVHRWYWMAASIEHDEIVAQSVHLDKGEAHPGHLGPHMAHVQW